MGYRVFTREFDKELGSAEVLQRLSEAVAEGPWSIPVIAESLAQQNPVAPLAGLPDGGDPVTLLLDCSGSMRGKPAWAAAAALRAIGDAMDASGRAFEILGFTTSAWKGGQSAMAFSRMTAEGGQRRRKPGRMNDLLHLVFKGRDDPWAAVRDSILLIMTPDVLKENVNGEALQWARGRMEEHPVRGSLILISDGMPMDDKTLSLNPSDYLLDHYEDVVEEMQEGGIPLATLLIGNEPTRGMGAAAGAGVILQVGSPDRPRLAPTLQDAMFAGFLEAVARLEPEREAHPAP